MPNDSGARGDRFGASKRLSLALLMLLALSLYAASPTAWAIPSQHRLAQTIPTLTPTPIPSWLWLGRPGGNPADYALSGMPDFDQRQGDWHDPQAADRWTHCGPASVADALWWLDSMGEPGSLSPPEVADGYALVSPYGAWDDHDPQNVAPLVQDLATRLGTQRDGEAPGTDITAVVPALQAYIAARGLDDVHLTSLVAAPSFERIQGWVQQGDGVVLLLGFWEWQGDAWVYLGGHYVAVAGEEPLNRYLALSDPYRDAWEAGQAVLGRSPLRHAYPHDSVVHNDSTYVSQDAFRIIPASGPGGSIALEGYVPAFAGVPNFAGQNVPPSFLGYLGAYSGSPVVTTKVDFAVVMSRQAMTNRLYLPVVWKRAS